MKRVLSFLAVVVMALLASGMIDCARAAAAPYSEFIAGPPAVAPEGSFFSTFAAYVLLFAVLALLVFAAGCVFYRRYHETEARVLTGNYIADGVESAWLKFPELLTMGADVCSANALAAIESLADPDNEEFSRWAERKTTVMRRLLEKLSAMPELAIRQPLLADLAATLESFKTKTLSNAELRPAWQLAFVFDLLVNRLRERPSEFTLSTTHTMVSALEVLAAVSRPGIRPDIIVDPPISVLAVDDDPLCLRAIAFAVQKSGITADTAADGASAVHMCAEKTYDVVFMDIMMPGIDGLEACRQLRSVPRNANTPVIFVTARSDFQTRERSVAVGGTEFMGKPFLVTEVTVKAVTFSMRKRLNLPMIVPSGSEPNTGSRSFPQSHLAPATKAVIGVEKCSSPDVPAEAA